MVTGLIIFELTLDLILWLFEVSSDYLDFILLFLLCAFVAPVFTRHSGRHRRR